MLEPDMVLQRRYRVVRSLGRGGMGAVYEAVDEHFGDRVALKEALVTDPTLAKAFEREARLLRTLRHSALPGVIDYFTEGDESYLVLELIEGEDLRRRVERDGRPGLPLYEALRMVRETCDALE